MNRLEWILGIMLVILLVVVAALSLMFWFRADTLSKPPASLVTEAASYASKVEPTSVYAGQTAQIAYVVAQKTAVSWQSDAVLLNASATWPQGSARQELLTGKTTWSFTFLSPTAKQIALISVLEDKASLVSESPFDQPAPSIDPVGWKLDSPDAVKQLLAEGGDNFIRNEGVTSLTMTLTADPEDGRIQWRIQLAATESLRLLTMTIDASSGELIIFNQTP